MTLSLHTLKPAHGANRKSRRIGRGHGSGRGTTAGRGTKGQRSRAGAGGGLRRLGLKQMLRSKKKIGGFRSLQPKASVISLEALEAAFASGSQVNPDQLKKAGLISRQSAAVKVLGSGKLTKKLTVQAHAFSASAKQAILDAGGSIEVIGPDKVQIKQGKPR